MRRKICFVTGTRAEFGLMRSVLQAIVDHGALQLQLIATGMHLDRSRGRSLDLIGQEGWKLDAVVPWNRGDGSQRAAAVATGKAIAAMAGCFERLRSDIVLVVGDRVEAFAAASAAHISGRLLAHVHGGDRALGLVDDSLRHAITKLTHVHFPATRQSAERLARLGEDRWRIFRSGSPGLDQITRHAAPWSEVTGQCPGLIRRRYALLLWHPQTPIDRQERRSAQLLLKSVRSVGFDHVVIIYPNNDPGSEGIARCWDDLPDDPHVIRRRDLPRAVFLGLLRDAAALVGNSSSGIIEAQSFGTPVLDVGSRQAGRERGQNVAHAELEDFSQSCSVRSTPDRLAGLLASRVSRATKVKNALDQRQIGAMLRKIWNAGRPIRHARRNIYGTGAAGPRIARVLADVDHCQFLPKLIAY